MQVGHPSNSASSTSFGPTPAAAAAFAVPAIHPSYNPSLIPPVDPAKVEPATDL